MSETEEKDRIEIESIADIRPILQALLTRIKAIEGFLASPKAQFGLYNVTAADKWQEIIKEEEQAKKQADEGKEQERARKQALVDKALKNPPICVECGETMTPKEPIPKFEVGSWTLKSGSPRTWYIVFQCPKSNTGLGAHPTFTVFPDDASQRIPRSKGNSKSVTRGYIPQAI